MVEVEPALAVDCETHGQVAVVRELEPRSDVRVVVELRDDDLVSGSPVPRSGA